MPKFDVIVVDNRTDKKVKTFEAGDETEALWLAEEEPWTEENGWFRY